MARLIVEKGHEKGRSIPLPPRTTTTFGRDTSTNVQIKDTMASRSHFKIEPRADGLWIVDLQSMNGTLLNGHPVRESLLKPGDLIRVGETTYSYLDTDDSADPMVGQKLGGYKLIERVGRGGMGTVYKAEQVDLQRIVALKIIAEEHLKKQDFVELFVHEARAAAKLNHPNIVQVYDVKKSGDLYFFSMEFVPGGSVQDLLNIKRKVPIADAVRMILEAARGLEYAHKKEIIHRDVKPDNFMIGEGGTIKIGDLGLAQRLGEKLSADNEDSVIGTPHYIAPEQVLGRPADIRSDVYSLGSTMYRMIAGFTPFQAPSVRDLVNKKAREEATPLHTALAGIPESLSKICERMMAKDPQQRIQSMTEVIAELEAWTRAGGEAAVEPREAPPVHRKLLLTAVALLGVVVVGGVIAASVMMKNGKQPVQTPEPAVVESGDPESKFDRAAAEESRLDDRKPDDFEGVIRLFEEIKARWPGTVYARDAETHASDLKKRRLSLMAARGLKALEEMDLESWKGILQGFQAGKLEVAEADKRRREFKAFADDPAWKGTAAATSAGARAAGLEAWLAEVEKRRAAFESLRAETEKLTGEMRYRDAWEKCNEFVSDIGAYVAPTKDRYTTLLYDVPARKLQEQIVDQATRGFEAAVAKAADLEAKGEFAKAVELIEGSVRHSLKEPVDRSKKILEELHKRWSAANRKAAELATLEQRKTAEIDRRDFDAAARRWREWILKFEPKSALADAQSHSKGAPDRYPRLPASAARHAARMTPLLILTEFKEMFQKAVNDRPSTIPNRITLDRMTGTITRASDTHLMIDLGSGQVERSYAEILAGGVDSNRAIQFLDYLRSAGKNADARWHLGLATLNLELGFYERAVDDLKTAEKSADEAVRRAVAELKPLAEDLRYPDSDEIEAQKHFDRLLVALKDASPRYDIAKTLQILRTRFGETELLAANKSRIEEIEKERADRETRERERLAKVEKYRKIDAAKQLAQSQSKNRESDILKGLSSLRDPIERSFHLGEAQFGFGTVATSTKTFFDGLNLAFPKVPSEKRNPQDQTLVWISRLGYALMRNLHLQKQERGVSDIRGRIDAKIGEDYPAWDAYKKAHDAWIPIVTDRLRKLAPLEKELQENPDPAVLHALAEANDVLRNAFEARGWYAALIAEFPEHEKSRSAETQLRLAEMTYQLRDVVEAERLYKKFKADFPTHPKVAQAAPFDPTSVENRIKSCNTLMNNMGLGK